MPMTRLSLRTMMYDTPDYLVAQFIPVSASKFSNWTLGRAKLPMRAVLRLSLLFDCDPNDLIGWATETTDPTTSSDIVALDGGILDIALVRDKDIRQSRARRMVRV